MRDKSFEIRDTDVASSDLYPVSSIPHPFVDGLISVFTSKQNAVTAASAKAYMRDQFEFFGLTSPVRKEISKAYIKTAELPPYDELAGIVLELYSMPEREFHYFAIEFISLYKKHWKQDIIQLFEKLILTNSWWDTVDYIAPVLAGNYFMLFPVDKMQITGRWNRSDNFWLQRSSLLFQKTYKRQTDTNLLSDYILNLASSKEFFVRKAIGWILREYAKTDREWVIKFVSSHALSPLSTKEALKHMTTLPKR